ncbi:SOS response-associated peptidase [Wenyingzhuangia sp. IMCC45574]
MCFHSKQTKKAKEVENRFEAEIEDLDNFLTSEHINAFNFPKTPVITNENVEIIQNISWGLIPNWSNDWNRTYTLNARIETLEEKPSFKGILENRCIIITNGFYEWKDIGLKKKVKYEIGFNNELFGFAGLWDLKDGIKTYTIITTEAKGIMREIHNTKLRMPYAFNELNKMRKWLLGHEIENNFDFSTINLEPEQTFLF